MSTIHQEVFAVNNVLISSSDRSFKLFTNKMAADKDMFSVSVYTSISYHGLNLDPVYVLCAFALYRVY